MNKLPSARISLQRRTEFTLELCLAWPDRLHVPAQHAPDRYSVIGDGNSHINLSGREVAGLYHGNLRSERHRVCSGLVSVPLHCWACTSLLKCVLCSTHNIRKLPSERKRAAQGAGADLLPASGGPTHRGGTAYLSKIERNVVPPPSEGTIWRLARDLEEDPDLLLAMAGKVSSDLLAVILQRPRLFADLPRQLKDAPDHAILIGVREVRDGDW